MNNNKITIFFTCAVTALLSSASYADSFNLSTNNSCKIHNQFPVSGETLSYDGECKDGYANGIGKVTWFINNKIHQISSGNYIKGKLEGECNIQVTNSKHSFIGICKDDMPTNGTYTYEDGSIYTGEFEYGRPKNKSIKK